MNLTRERGLSNISRRKNFLAGRGFAERAFVVELNII